MFLQDLRYAVRAMRRSPGVTAVGIMILALGIATTTAVFSVVNAVLLRPMPYPDPSRLVALSRVSAQTSREGPVALQDLEAWRAQTRSLSGIGSFVFTELPVKIRDQSFSVVTAAVDPELLTTLGTAPALGTNFSGSGSAHPDASAIITHRLWIDAFDGDGSVVGRTISVDGKPFTVAGVLPPAFQFPRADASYFEKDVDLLIPVANIADGWGRASTQWFAIGRLAAGVTPDQAQAEMSALAAHLSTTRPGEATTGIRLSRLAELTARRVRPALLLILGISAILLLIACLNVMSLWFSRSAARSREIAIRKAIGAGVGRIVRQLMTETACLTAVAGAIGVLLARVFQDLVVALSPVHLPVSGRIDLDGHVLAFAAVICGGAAALSGLLPALHSSVDREHLLSGAGTRASRGRLLTNVQRVLTVTQVALGLALLTGAGLLINSLWRLSIIDPGFRTANIAGFSFAVPADHPDDRNPMLYERMLAAVGALPGVESAGLITYLPPEQRKGVIVPFTIDGRSSPAGRFERTLCNFQMTSEDYFKTLGIPVLTGRGFTPSDTGASAPVAIVNEVFAQRFFPDGRALGRSVKTMFDSRPLEIVGVIRSIHDRGLGTPAIPTAYVPFRQFAFGYGSIAVRASVSLTRLAPDIRARMREVDPGVPVAEFQTLEDRVHHSLNEPRFYTVIASVCAVMAVLFVTLGLYGVIAYSVSRRTAEIGIRLAIGAQRAAIFRMVVLQGLILGATGAAIGTALAFWLTRLLRGLLFDVKPADPGTFAAAVSLLLAVTVLASYLPARRASRVDPIVALRHE